MSVKTIQKSHIFTELGMQQLFSVKTESTTRQIVKASTVIAQQLLGRQALGASISYLATTRKANTFSQKNTFSHFVIVVTLDGRKLTRLTTTLPQSILPPPLLPSLPTLTSSLHNPQTPKKMAIILLHCRQSCQRAQLCESK